MFGLSLSLALLQKVVSGSIAISVWVRVGSGVWVGGIGTVGEWVGAIGVWVSGIDEGGIGIGVGLGSGLDLLGCVSGPLAPVVSTVSIAVSVGCIGLRFRRNDGENESYEKNQKL